MNRSNKQQIRNGTDPIYLHFQAKISVSKLKQDLNNISEFRDMQMARNLCQTCNMDFSDGKDEATAQVKKTFTPYQLSEENEGRSKKRRKRG